MQNKLKLNYYPYTMELKRTFTVSSNSRTSTPAVMTEIEYEGYTGYGEASLPPYLGETQESAMNFLSGIDLSGYTNVFDLETILAEMDAIAPGNTAAKAAIDIALHDLTGKVMNQPLCNIWGLNKDNTPYTSFTIGIDTPEIIKEKVEEAGEYKILKVKLGTENDREIIKAVRSVSRKPIIVDVNQGWRDRDEALDLAYWLKSKNVMLIEQPFPKENIEDNAWLTKWSPLPIIADESVQRLSDVINAKDVFTGINIKLMKCTGIREAYKMISFARALGLKVMLGCMTETSCAISAASHLSPLVDYTDLDGALLISNDLFEGTKIINGKVTLSGLPGIGVEKKSETSNLKREM
jgi:L-alanine-DL-glutamate epimerase-like enolase superfamily enzyme